MWLKNDGAILAELLLSLSAILMISLYFAPLWLDISNQIGKLQIEKYSYQLVYEELESQIINGQPSPNHTVVKNGIEFQIIWSQAAAEQMEVCVSVEKNPLHPESKICGLSE